MAHSIESSNKCGLADHHDVSKHEMKPSVFLYLFRFRQMPSELTYNSW